MVNNSGGGLAHLWFFPLLQRERLPHASRGSKHGHQGPRPECPPVTAEQPTWCQASVLFGFDVNYVDDVVFRVEDAVQLHFLADEFARHILIVQVIHVSPGDQNKFTAQLLNAIHSTGGCRMAGRARF